ncbi:carbon-nitrogen hydrolase family protein [Maricaulis sp.]|uniref:carbon-nitrogen hydrolase family protein n=1 Tax=Maricaulis sp. TaxID=1486257 RepID=UPI00261154F0|nr:carbon-nitrogen hydrolase family protein [Maricaulis sp.]
MDLVEANTPADIGERDALTVALAQIAPVWLRREESLAKIADVIATAAGRGAQLVVFGEALVPGYPFWIERTGGARFNDARQKAFYARYVDQAVIVERDLPPICELARRHAIAVYLGIVERAPDRSGTSLYCSLVHIGACGRVLSVHRKLQPTYEERLAWAPGDGQGLVVHDLGPFRVGGLNCYENWMPLSRSALYAQGEDLHVSVWPGGLHNTRALPGFIAQELRGYVIACSGLMRPQDFPAGTPLLDEILAGGESFLANGGSCIARPDGNLLVEPVLDCEALILAHLDHADVRAERQNFDVAGHYSRPDVTRLTVNRDRQAIAGFTGGAEGDA